MKTGENNLKLLLADLHISPFRKEKFKSQKKNAVEWIIQLFADLLKQKEEIIFTMMMKVVREHNISLAIVNGDMMESSATERGLREEIDLQAARIVKKWLEALLGLAMLILNMGNHESGYNLPLSTDPQAGISLKSLKNFLRLTERENLYFSFDIRDFRMIFIPYLFTEDFAVDFDIDSEKKKFLQKMAIDLASSEKVIVMAHDPDSLDDSGLRNILLANIEKIKFFFCGHYHSKVTLQFMKVLIAIFNSKLLFLYRWPLKLILWFAFMGNSSMVKKVEEYFQKRRNIPRLIKEFRVEIIPAPTGMFGMGGGFLTLDLETMEITKH